MSQGDILPCLQVPLVVLSGAMRKGFAQDACLLNLFNHAMHYLFYSAFSAPGDE